MPQAKILFEDSEMNMEASEVYVLAAAYDILSRIQSQIGDVYLYPEDFIKNIESSLALLTFLVERTIPQLRKQ